MKLMLLAFLITAAGAGLLGRDGYRRVKGLMATRLVAAATDEYLKDGAEHAPWSWADFHPIGRLYVPRLDVSQDILAGGVNQAMAFGLASLPYTASPDEAARANVPSGPIGLPVIDPASERSSAICGRAICSYWTRPTATGPIASVRSWSCPRAKCR